MSFTVGGLKIKLSQKELDIIFFLEQGLTAEIIGKKVFLSKRSIESIISKLKKKMKCNSLLQLGFVVGMFHLAELSL